jgi:hypothetical protein
MKKLYKSAIEMKNYALSINYAPKSIILLYFVRYSIWKLLVFQQEFRKKHKTRESKA